MTMSSRALVDLVLLGPTNDRRQLQDSPILGDVWSAYAAKPAATLDLLITPFKECPSGPVARDISERIKAINLRRKKDQEANVAYLQGLIAARLLFREVVRIIVPMTQWWRDQQVQSTLNTYSPDVLNPIVKTIVEWAKTNDEDKRANLTVAFGKYTALQRFIVLAGIILWAGLQNGNKTTRGDIGDLLGKIKGSVDPTIDAIGKGLHQLFEEIKQDSQREKEEEKENICQGAKVWQISLNRKAMPALEKSVAAVKADAALTLFSVKCNEIRWAVLDSGIDYTHPALKDELGQNFRVEKTFDFSYIRKIVSLDNKKLSPAQFKKRHGEFFKNLKKPLKESDAIKILDDLAKDAENDRPPHWGLVEQLIEIDPSQKEPHGGHGTHVAGIIGARKVDNFPAGMCPDIKLYDFRVLSHSMEDTEFAIIAALQYIRYLNGRNNFMVIHGANLSLAIPHDVRNFACGRTPICNECERLVESGVVVVAAAGNLGYHRYETQDGSYEGYAAFSITDPGNAGEVITVGATHRFWPHTYGVSFFSSRGPTGDGRLKPDLVAPGERIQSLLPNRGMGMLDGTSMAAPHVSGAAAMLLARYSELIGQPRRIKRILCETATDLERERTFQGHGMLDVLRAFQSI